MSGSPVGVAAAVGAGVGASAGPTVGAGVGVGPAVGRVMPFAVGSGVGVADVGVAAGVDVALGVGAGVGRGVGRGGRGWSWRRPRGRGRGRARCRPRRRGRAGRRLRRGFGGRGRRGRRLGERADRDVAGREAGLAVILGTRREIDRMGPDRQGALPAERHPTAPRAIGLPGHGMGHAADHCGDDLGSCPRGVLVHDGEGDRRRRRPGPRRNGRVGQHGLGRGGHRRGVGHEQQGSDGQRAEPRSRRVRPGSRRVRRSSVVPDEQDQPPGPGGRPMRCRGCPRLERRAMVRGSGFGQPSGGTWGVPVASSHRPWPVRCGPDRRLVRPPRAHDPEGSLAARSLGLTVESCS